MYDDHAIVINDLLSFMSCKIKVIPRKDLIKCLKEFYSKEDIDRALKTFIRAFPLKQRRIFTEKWFRNCCDSLLVLYNLLNENTNKNLPIFMCKDLNNIPNMDLEENSQRIVSGHSDLLNEQKIIKSQISEIVTVICQLKEQIHFLLQTKKRNSHKNKKKGLAYLQKLIDEEDQNFEETGLNEDIEEQVRIPERDEDIDIFPDEERFLHVKPRMQKIVKNVNKETVSKNIQHYVREPETEREKYQFSGISTQKVIHINHSVLESSSDMNDSETDSSYKIMVEDATDPDVDLDLGDKGNYPFIDIEQVFDENVGHFSIYKCCLCNFRTNDSSAIEQHDCPQIYSEVDDSLSTSCQFFCLVCRFKCSSKLLYERHAQVHPQVFPCPFCDEKDLGYDNWTTHVKACITTNNITRSNHICQVCGIIYANSGALLVHKGFHDPAKPYECLKCRYRFYTEETLNRHFKAHITKGFRCPFCHFTNKNKTTLGTHIRCHTGEMPFACDFCHYRSSSQSALTTHLLCHTDKKTFQCNDCDSLFKSVHKLNAHKITHIKNRVHKCPVCRKGFKTGWLMTIHHQRIHLNVRPYSCAYCSYRARSISALKSHYTTHTNEKQFKCSQCDFKANLKSYLKRHVNQVHQGTIKEVQDMVPLTSITAAIEM